MTKGKLTREEAWRLIFDAKGALEKIEADGVFVITAEEINAFNNNLDKKIPDARVMASITSKEQLPQVFSKNDLAILPLTRGTYAISHFDLYQPLQTNAGIKKVSPPPPLKTLGVDTVSNESVAIALADYGGILADFLGEEDAVATQSGRMKSGDFSFYVRNTRSGEPFPVEVHNAQIEIDGSFETPCSYCLIEAKNVKHDEFLIRQLFYPMRAWLDKVGEKKIRPVFFLHMNSVFHLYEYCFEDPSDYNSLVLVQQQNYTFDELNITRADVKKWVAECPIPLEEPQHLTIPQADSFERVINLCELLSQKPATKGEIYHRYGFTERQSDYYSNAGRYLGLIHKDGRGENPTYTLTAKGESIFSSNKDYRQRQEALIKTLMEHAIFYELIPLTVDNGIPQMDTIREITAKHSYGIGETTITRRAGTVRGWLNWLDGIIEK